MAEPDRCPECGSERVGGICPSCLIRLGLDGPALSLDRLDGPGATIGMSALLGDEGNVLASLAATVGPVPRVLLRDAGWDVETEADAEPVVRPSSPEMPPQSQSGRAGRLHLF